MWGLQQKQNARRADKIRLYGHLRRYKKIVKKTYIIYIKSYYISDNQSLAQHQSSFFLTAAITAPAANASPAIGTIGDPAVSPVCTALSSSFGSSWFGFSAAFSKFAFKVSVLSTLNVNSALSETAFPSTVQFTNLYPSFAAAVAVTTSPSL